ncbi:hypothetical protein AWZ03_013395 [Drosophila navojoa]|uniref:Uncharacterized protein n=1 Tax=Drosophila navojoa TaxID=7232 RepID=A0A484AX40_DRONA|nr:hypothetical protein AWZ03_013395 [Drosophila navojoa]
MGNSGKFKMEAVADFLMGLYHRAKMNIMWLFSDWLGRDQRLQMESELYNIPFNELRELGEEMEFYMNNPDGAIYYPDELAFRAANPENRLPAGVDASGA